MAKAPQMQLERLDGELQPLSDYIGQGKWVVMNVWSPSCTFCVQELPHLVKFQEKYRNKITVLGVTIDFPSFEYGKKEVINQFLKKFPLDYPLFLADIDSASEVIGIRLVGIPLIAIFHPDGRPLVRWPGTIELDEIENYINNYQEDLNEDNLIEGF